MFSEGEDEALPLALDMLTVLEESDNMPMLLPILFRARYAFSQGYAPRLSHCAHCGRATGKPYGDIDGEGYATDRIANNKLKKPERYRFMVREGTLTCPKCPPMQGTFVDISKETLDALRFVQQNPPLQWSKLALSPQVRREFSRAMDGFIQYHIGLTWENGRFRRL